jgi:hypothetical protein
MRTIVWLLLFALAVAAGWLIWRSLRQWEARKRAEEQRFANFMAGTTAAAKPRAAAPAALTAPLPQAANGLAQQRMLFEAAHKAGAAGEPALAIELYGRLLARYPATAFADQARAAVEALKKKLVKN